MSDLQCLKYVYSLLRLKDYWQLDVVCPEDIDDLAIKSEIYATQKIKNMSLLALWKRYKAWRKNEPIIHKEDEYFQAFLTDTAYHLALDNLMGSEKLIFEDCCYFKFRFI